MTKKNMKGSRILEGTKENSERTHNLTSQEPSQDDIKEEELELEDLEETSTLVEKLPFKKWIESRNDSRTAASQHVSPLIKLYWGIAEKHERHLKKKEVLPLEESENDRQLISDAYKKASTLQELEYDQRVYRALVRMQELRDLSYLLEELDNRYKMELIAWELKIRQHPIFILPHLISPPKPIDDMVKDLQNESGLIFLHQHHDAQSQQKWEIESSPILLETHHVTKPIPYIKIDEKKRSQIRKKLFKELKNKTFFLTELSRRYNSLELQILSKMLKKGELLAIFAIDSKKVSFLEPKKTNIDNQGLMMKKCAIVMEGS